MQFTESFRQAFKALVAEHGLDRTFIQLGEMAGEHVGVLRPNGHPFKTVVVGQFKDAGSRRPAEPRALALSETDAAFVRRAGLDPAAVAADMERERRERADRKAAENGPLTLTDTEAAMVRRMGHDPRMVAAMRDGTTYADWKRLKATGGGA